MRSRLKDKQAIWICKAEETLDGIDTVLSYSEPIKVMATVSRTIDVPGRTSAGIMLDYDRYVVLYDRRIEVKEGYLFYIDVEPIYDDDGNLINDPDYRARRVLDTQKGVVRRIGIRKIEGMDD